MKRVNLGVDTGTLAAAVDEAIESRVAGQDAADVARERVCDVVGREPHAVACFSERQAHPVGILDWFEDLLFKRWTAAVPEERAPVAAIDDRGRVAAAG